MTERDRIVVGVNNSAAAESALRWALGQARHTGATVAAVYVFDVRSRADLALERDVELERLESERRAQARVSALASEEGEGIHVTFAGLTDDVESALLASSEQASMLVVGRPQTSQHARLVETLAAQCRCPLVVVSESGEIRAPAAASYAVHAS